MQTYLEWISNAVPLYSTENYIQPLGVKDDGQQYEKKNVYICIYDWVSLLYGKNWHITVNQLYFRGKKLGSSKSGTLPGNFLVDEVQVFLKRAFSPWTPLMARACLFGSFFLACLAACFITRPELTQSSKYFSMSLFTICSWKVSPPRETIWDEAEVLLAQKQSSLSKEFLETVAVLHSFKIMKFS